MERERCCAYGGSCADRGLRSLQISPRLYKPSRTIAPRCATIRDSPEVDLHGRGFLDTRVLALHYDGRRQLAREGRALHVRENVGAICVTEGSLVGMLTDRDTTTKAVSEGWHPAQHRVGEIMSRNPICVSPDADPLQPSELIAKHHYRRLPVSHDGQIDGIVSFADIAAYTRGCLDNLVIEETKAER
jgi:CBS domain-containing protein